MINVNSPSGKYTGRQESDGSAAFLGIKYATSERFSPPVACGNSSNDVDVLTFGSSPMQTPGMLEQLLGMGQGDYSEDCLFLNVYVPSTLSATPKPVLFWIYGGAFVNGSSSISWYDGKNLAEQADAVVVSCNYRLGVFGFLGQSNLGILDQICALQWVHTNISAFGGNSNNVTIFGESAGGSSVVALMSAPEAQPYFQKAWAMSPSIGQFSTTERCKVSAVSVCEAAQVATVDALKGLTVEQLLAAQDSAIKSNPDPFSAFAPVQGGTGLPNNILQAASENPKPFVIGTNKDESRLWVMFNPDENQLDEAGALQALERRIGKQSSTTYKLYESQRPEYTPSQLVAAYDSDANFRNHAWNLLELRAQQQSKSWSYWFTWGSPAFDGMLGSCHALDIPFFFSNIKSPGADMFIGSGSVQEQLATTTLSALSLFASTGAVDWPQFEIAKRPTMIFDDSCGVTNSPDDVLHSFWRSKI
jgi:para-nitrobenzyl esterase